MQRIFYICVLLVLFVFLLSDEVSAKIHGNPAMEIMTLINKNRTSIKLPKLHDNSGLGCMALQLISQCSSNCTENNTLTCAPPEIDITEIYAANCGVELPTVETVTDHLIACNWNYLPPDEALAKISNGKNGSGILKSKENVEAGAAFSVAGHKGPYFWCVLFSDAKGNKSFVLEGGKGIEQKNGCFSGGDLTCSVGCNVIWLGFRKVGAIAFLCFLVSFFV